MLWHRCCIVVVDAATAAAAAAEAAGVCAKGLNDFFHSVYGTESQNTVFCGNAKLFQRQRNASLEKFIPLCHDMKFNGNIGRDFSIYMHLS